VPIRSATAADLPAMLALLGQSPSAAQWSETQFRELFGGESPRRVCLVAEAAAGLAGFVVAHNVEAEWEIENIVVAESARRRGVGTQLLARLLDRVRSSAACSLFLEVRDSNLAARRLYEKFSFVAAGRRPLYYHNPVEDAVIYRLDLA
jgi:ribosomal-protein-alanine N-acetyltransferase